MEYRPDSVETPTGDANHVLLKTVTYDLADLINAQGGTYDGNLEIKVAAATRAAHSPTARTSPSPPTTQATTRSCSHMRVPAA